MPEKKVLKKGRRRRGLAQDRQAYNHIYANMDGAHERAGGGERVEKQLAKFGGIFSLKNKKTGKAAT